MPLLDLMGTVMKEHGLLGPYEIRQLTQTLGIRPTKSLGQNFVHDAGTVRRIVREAGVCEGEHVLEVGPGLGSLTLALLEAGAKVSAVEIDPVLAKQLPTTIAARMPEAEGRLAVRLRDAMQITSSRDLAVPHECEGEFVPTALVANLPYNVAVPVILTLLEAIPSLERVLVMVQAEVADRLAAAPGSRTYGVPSVKAAWYASARRGSKISRTVFWPVPNVDSALVELIRRPEQEKNLREATFDVVDAAFAQRRKTLRGALSSWAGSPLLAEEILCEAGIDPSLRGEKLGLAQFVAIARAGIAHGLK